MVLLLPAQWKQGQGHSSGQPSGVQGGEREGDVQWALLPGVDDGGDGGASSEREEKGAVWGVAFSTGHTHKESEDAKV